jgi:lipopolysaccharide transport system permease protein
MPQTHQDPIKSPLRIISPETEPGHATAGLLSLWSHRRLLWDFVARDLKRRYTGSSIGFFWSVITPLLELATYTFVFHGLIGVRFQPSGGWANYALFLFSGMVTWLALSDGLSQATASITSHSHLIKKLSFPTIILPAHLVLSACFNQGIRLSILVVAVGLMGGGLSWHLAFLPFFMVVQLAFTLGLGLMLATAQVYFRDTCHMVNAVLLLWMFVTPVFYPAASYPKKFILLLQLNPLAHLVGVYRELVLNHTMPHPNSLIIILVMSALSLLVGYSVFHHHQKGFADLV